jgi:hypothetical protein
LVVNSPIEAPNLVAEVKQDWGGIGSDGLLASLLTDARAGSELRVFSPALRRLRFYYPEEYQLHKTGDLKLKIEEFEAAALNPQ